MKKTQLLGSGFAALVIACLHAAAHADNTPPHMPEVIRAETDLCRSVELFWRGGFDYGSRLRDYKIYKDGAYHATTRGTPSVQVASRDGVETRYYKVSGLESSRTYRFSVRSIDFAGNESPLALFPMVTTLAPNAPACVDTTPPAAPDKPVLHETRSCHEVVLASRSTAQAFLWYRDNVLIGFSEQGGGWTYLYDLAGLEPGTQYEYVVRAMDDAGNLSNPSPALSVTMPECGDYSVGQKGVGIIGVYFDGDSLPATDLNKMRQAIFSIDGSAPDNVQAWLTEVSGGMADLFWEATYGWSKLPRTAAQYGCTQFEGHWDGCDPIEIARDALSMFPAHAAWEIAAIYVNKLRRSFFIGKPGVPRRLVLASVDSHSLSKLASSFVHELGHSFGLHHSERILCPPQGGVGEPAGSGEIGRSQNDAAFGCAILGYGDDYTPMGQSRLFHLSALEKRLVGWLPASQERTLVDGANQVVFIYANDRSWSRTKLVRIPWDFWGGTPGFSPFSYVLDYSTLTGFNGSLSGAPASLLKAGVDVRKVARTAQGMGSNDAQHVWIKRLTAESPLFVDPHQGVKFELLANSPMVNPARVRVCRTQPGVNSDGSYSTACLP